MNSIKLSHTLLTFMCIFGFSLRHGKQPDSQILAGVYLLCYMLFHPGYFRVALRIMSGKRFTWILLFYIFMNLWSFFSLSVNFSSDLSFHKTLLHMFLVIVICHLFFAYLQYLDDTRNIVNYIALAFLMQTAIQWASFLSPAVRDAIVFTKSDEAILRIHAYGGVRGNGLTSANFFGLSAAYASFFLLYWSKQNTLFRKNAPLKLLFYIVTGTGTFFAGRTGYIGLGVGIVYNHLKKKRRLSFYKREWAAGIGVTLCFCIALATGVAMFNKNENFQVLFAFTFQNVIKWMKTGNASTSSLETLKSMYFMPSVKTLLLGDGRYAAVHGDGYYMHTDVGYLRVILFSGVVGFLFMLCMQVFMLELFRGEKSLKYTALFLLLVLNLKGEVIAWGQVLIPIYLLYSFRDSCANIHCANKRRKDTLRLWQILQC